MCLGLTETTINFCKQNSESEWTKIVMKNIWEGLKRLKM